MAQSLTEFRNQYREALLSFLWRQWTILGVQGHQESKDQWAIDPEALLLFTCTIARHDPRLFDEVLDWLDVNGRFINIQRLQTILRKEKFMAGKVISAIAEFMSQHHKYLKWKTLAKNIADQSPAESLFFLNDGKPMELFGRFDSTFKQHGLLRGNIELRGHTQPVRVNLNPALLFKLRSLFGMNARCEIFLFLMTHEDGAHPSWIARETYYSQKTVQDTLVDITSSGLVQSYKTGREKRYLLKSNDWLNFLKLASSAPPLWINWPPIFSVLEKIWIKLNDETIFKMKPLLLSSVLRSLMLEVKSKIEQSGFASTLSDDRLYHGKAYINIFMKDVNKLILMSTKTH